MHRPECLKLRGAGEESGSEDGHTDSLLGERNDIRPTVDSDQAMFGVVSSPCVNPG